MEEILEAAEKIQELNELIDESLGRMASLLALLAKAPTTFDDLVFVFHTCPCSSVRRIVIGRMEAKIADLTFEETKILQKLVAEFSKTHKLPKKKKQNASPPGVFLSRLFCYTNRYGRTCPLSQI